MEYQSKKRKGNLTKKYIFNWREKYVFHNLIKHSKQYRVVGIWNCLWLLTNVKHYLALKKNQKPKKRGTLHFQQSKWSNAKKYINKNIIIIIKKSYTFHGRVRRNEHFTVMSYIISMYQNLKESMHHRSCLKHFM